MSNEQKDKNENPNEKKINVPKSEGEASGKPAAHDNSKSFKDQVGEDLKKWESQINSRESHSKNPLENKSKDCERECYHKKCPDKKCNLKDKNPLRNLNIKSMMITKKLLTSASISIDGLYHNLKNSSTEILHLR